MADTPGDVPPSDVELLARHVAGDHDAFGELVHRHRERLWAVALRTLGDPEEAADALQDALVAAFRAAHTFQGRAAVTTWLHRIVVNACLDRIRRATTRRTRSLEEFPAPQHALGTAEGADVSAEQAELRHEVATALAALPADQRAALVLVDLQGYSVAEAAAVLSIPAGTVKSRCARGRARLLPSLGHLRTRRVEPAGEDTRAEGSPSGAAARGTRSSGADPEATEPAPESSAGQGSSRGGSASAARRPGRTTQAPPEPEPPDRAPSASRGVSRETGAPASPPEQSARTDAPPGGRNRTGNPTVPVVDPSRPEGRR